ncbi:MAG: hypothetical protein AAF208_01870 [Cyanobacteria bacterium P01_A01_bin.45]
MGALETNTKKLIKYGWDSPRPEYMQKHIKEMEEKPFDGIIFKLAQGNQVFKNEVYDAKIIDKEIEFLKTTDFKKFTDNFVMMWLTPDKGWDWFSDSDWEKAKQNIYLFTKVVKKAELEGIAFDAEPYIANTWRYSDFLNNQGKSYEDYYVQVRKRGAQFLSILQDEISDLKLFGLFYMSYVSDGFEVEDEDKLIELLSEHSYGLLPAFINGMLDVIKPSSVIIDGNENAYYFNSEKDFIESRELIKQKALSLIEPENRSKYNNQVSVGQAVFFDNSYGLLNPNELNHPSVRVSHSLSKNNKKKLLEHNMYHALSNSDKYVWLYDTKVNWWEDKVPKAAIKAIVSAKDKIMSGKDLGFSIKNAIDEAYKGCCLKNK